MPNEVSNAPTVLANDSSDDGVITIGGKRYRTYESLARLYGVSPRTMIRWKPPTILLGKLRLTDEDDLPRWMAERKTGGGDAESSA